LADGIREKEFLSKQEEELRRPKNIEHQKELLKQIVARKYDAFMRSEVDMTQAEMLINKSLLP